MSVAVDMRRFMSEERAGYRVGDASTDTSEPDQREPVMITEARGWYARVPAGVIRDRRLTSGARDVLLALLLYANPDGVCYPKQTTIADDLGIRREEVNRRLRALRDLGYLRIEPPHTKGGPAVYHLTLDAALRCDQTRTPSTESTCDETVTSSTSQGVIKRAQVSPRCDQTRTGGVIKQSHVEHIQVTERDSANALRTADADATPEPPSSSQPSPAPAKTKRAARPRKLTNEQLEAHRIEQGYIADLLAAVKAETHTQALPMEGRERQAAHWFYRAHDGEPAPVADVMTCYRLTKRGAFWRGKYLSLQHLEGCYVSYRADPAAYARDNPANGRRAPAASQPEPPSRPMRSVPPVNAKPAQLD